MNEKKVFYEKVGKKYVPVAEHDYEFLNRIPFGTHLIIVKPGQTLKLFNVEPAFAPMIAAGTYAEDAVSSAIVAAQFLRLGKTQQPLTPEQQDAWHSLVNAFGESAKRLEWPSAREAAEAGVKAMTKEVEKLLSNPAVKKSYNHFMLTCKLAYDQST